MSRFAYTNSPAPVQCDTHARKLEIHKNYCIHEMRRDLKNTHSNLSMAQNPSKSWLSFHDWNRIIQSMCLVYLRIFTTENPWRCSCGERRWRRAKWTWCHSCMGRLHHAQTLRTRNVDTAYLMTEVILYIGRIVPMGCEKISRGNLWVLSPSPENKITSGSEWETLTLKYTQYHMCRNWHLVFQQENLSWQQYTLK